MGEKPAKWGPPAGSMQLEAALAKRNRWWIRWVVAAVLVAIALIAWNEYFDEPAPSVYGGESLRAAPNELPYPEPAH